MSGARPTLKVAVFAPLRRVFEYLPPASVAICSIAPGTRVRVPFGRGNRTGVVLGSSLEGNDADYQLKSILEILDDAPVLDPDVMGLARWAAAYYHHPIGDVLATMLPTLLRRGPIPALAKSVGWRLTDSGVRAAANPLMKAPRQAELLHHLVGGSVNEQMLQVLNFSWRRVMRQLVVKQWVERIECEPIGSESSADSPTVMLNEDQRRAVDHILGFRDTYRTILLQGVTGSGKTEVYMHSVQAITGDGLQALVLVPEIALTEQIVSRFKQRFGTAVGVLHSGVSDRERAQTWLASRQASVSIVLGTRSAVWVPLPKLGLIIVDEEHDPSYKQQDGFKYCARDIAVVRAQRAGVPIMLGSATPSLESYHNVARGKYVIERLPARAGGAKTPSVKCIDIRGLRLRGGLSDQLIGAMAACLDRGEQALLFLNRRGYAPLVICHRCGWVAECERCDAYLVMHKNRADLLCHHCGAKRSLARRFSCCSSPETVPLGTGTERLEESLAEIFPDKRIVRVDRDSIRNKRALEQTFSAIEKRHADIVIGTQMLAKGHDFKGVTLVGIVDADSRLYSLDFRSEERLAQMLVQVAGRAGRARNPGIVLIQTHHPGHPVLSTLFQEDYGAFVARALDERRAAALPPFRSMAVIRAETGAQTVAGDFLIRVRALLEKADVDGIDISGPVAATMEKKGGKYRAALLLTARRRGDLARVLRHLLTELEGIPQASTVRWAVDVDPQDVI